MENLELKEKILNAIQEKNSSLINEIFVNTPAIDIAETLEDVEDVTKLLYIFKVVPSEFSAPFFTELTNKQQQLIIDAFGDKQLIELLDHSFADDVVDSMNEMPANMVNRILKVAPSDLRTDINRLLNYKEDTAGSVMTTEYIEMKKDISVSDAIDKIRKNGREAETIYTIFVRDNTRTLIGTVNLDDLIFAQNEQTLEEIMNRNYVYVNVDTDQEQVAEMFKRYDLNAMAVVNRENKLCGIITIDDVVDIIVEEATEDMALLNKTAPMEQKYLDTPLFTLVKKCVPWIIVLMVLEIFSSVILSGFQSEIAKFSVLSVFTPLIMDAGGNSGGQTTTIIIRSLALNEFNRGDVKKVFWKEFRLSVIIGLIVSVFAFAWLMFEMATGIVECHAEIGLIKIDNDWIVRLCVAGLVAITLFIVMIFSRLVGCSLPFIAKALKRDPAVMCGPLMTTIVDVIALLSYFLVWVLCFGPILGL